MPEPSRGRVAAGDRGPSSLSGSGNGAVSFPALDIQRLVAVALVALTCSSCRHRPGNDAADAARAPAPSTAVTSSGDVAEDDSADTAAEGQPARADADGIPTEPAPTATPAEPPVETSAPSGGESGANHAAEPEADTQQPPTGQGDAGISAAGGASAEYPLQENPLAGCTLCHVDVEDEFVGSIHFEEKTGCKTCHGPSEGHLADENNEVKPDEVFARKDVDRLCGRCHECPREVPAKPELTAEGQPKVCIDCHGPHDVKLMAKSP